MSLWHKEPEKHGVTHYLLAIYIYLMTSMVSIQIKKELSLETTIVKTIYKTPEARFSRRSFISYSDNVFINNIIKKGYKNILAVELYNQYKFVN